MRERTFYLDRLKVVLTALVVLHHLSITYGGSGSWYYKEGAGSELAEGLLTMFTAVNQSFFMGLFFFISGWATPASFERKGAGRFLKDRMLRFGLPILAYVLLLAPLLHYVSWGRQGEVSFGEYVLEDILRHPNRQFQGLDLGPLWFIWALFLFNAGYALFRRITAGRQPATARRLTPGLIAFYLVTVGAANFLVRLAYPVGETFLSFQLAYFPAYILLYAGGIQAYRSGWLEQLTARNARRSGLVALGLIALLPVMLVAGGALGGSTEVFEGGLTWQSAFYSAVDPVLGLTISYWLLVRFRDRKAGPPSTRARWLSDRAFTVYVIHPPVAVYTAFALKGWALHPLVKFLAVGPLTLVLCWLLAAVVRILLQNMRISYSIPSNVGR